MDNVYQSEKEDKKCRICGRIFIPQKPSHLYCYRCWRTIKILIEEFIKALQEEIDNFQKKESRVSIVDGRLIRKEEALYVYSFHPANEDKIYTGLDGVPIKIQVNGLRYSGEIIGTEDSEIVIYVNTDLGEFISNALLIIDHTFLYKILKEKFKAILESKDIFKEYFWLSNSIFIEKARFFQAKSELRSLLFDFPLVFNQSQIRAIQISQQSPLTLIWGPPGTGKTKTIAGVVAEFLKQGKKVLVTAHSNIAVDEVTMKIAELLKEIDYYKNGEILRIGNYQKKELKSDYPLVLPQKILEHKMQLDIQKRNQLIGKRRKIRDYKKREEHEQKIKEKQWLQEDLEDKTNFLNELQDEKKAKKLLQELAKTIGKDEAQQRIKRRRINLRMEITEIERKLQDISLIETRFEKIKKIRLSLEQILEYERKINNSIAVLDKKIAKVKSEILFNARVVCTTLTKTFSDSWVSGRFFDVLIIDEASMAPMPYIYWALGRCENNVVIVGDFLQLQPICDSGNEEGMAKKWLCRSIYNYLELDTVPKAVNEKKVCMLETQYRMNPKISKISNEIFYYNFLKDGEETKTLNFDFGEFEGHLFLVDTSYPPASICEKGSLGSSRVNEVHAKVAVKAIKKILNSQEYKNQKIGVITPYRAQSELIRKKIKEEKIKSKNISVSTVHSFQGGEADIIIFDTVDAPGLETSHFMLDDGHKELLNVALTRAKCKLFLIVNLDFIKKRFPKTSFMIKIIDIFKHNGSHIRFS